MVNKDGGALGLIKMWLKEFDEPYITKTLLISLVRSILEYGSLVWSSQYGIHVDRTEELFAIGFKAPKLRCKPDFTFLL